MRIAYGRSKGHNYTNKVLLAAGKHAAQYFEDTGECLFCSGQYDTQDNVIHEDFCPFFPTDSKKEAKDE